jgi:predicted nucleotidyltransferase
MTTLQELLRRAADDVGGPVVVLLFASSGIEPEIVQMAETLEVFPGRRLKIARPGHLIAVKLLARSEARPQDAADLRSLLAVADDAELKLAAGAVE